MSRDDLRKASMTMSTELRSDRPSHPSGVAVAAQQDLNNDRWAFRAYQAVVDMQRAARGKAACRRVQHQRERLASILADEEARWRGRVSGRDTAWEEERDERYGWEKEEVVQLQRVVLKEDLSNASTRCASPRQLDPIASMSSLEDMVHTATTPATTLTPKLLG